MTGFFFLSIYEYFLTVYGLSIHFPNGIYCGTEFLSFVNVHYHIFFFYGYAFCGLFMKPLLIPDREDVFVLCLLYIY